MVQELVLGQVRTLGSEEVELSSCAGRVLAHDIVTPDPIPLWSNSAMDGYAVLCADWVKTSQPILTLLEEVPAGKVPLKALSPGFCTRIMTGAMVPEGADAIVMQERTTNLADGQVQFHTPIQVGQFIRRRGEFRQAGEILIHQGTLITPAEIAILASLNIAQVTVYRRPIVAILSTGDELRAVGTPVMTGQITDSNQPMLCALVTQHGGIAQPIGIVPDTPDALREVLIACKHADFIISSGGVSVGTYDYVETVLAELGAQILVTQVNLKPGKPLTFAQWEQILYWGLPGNPVSAFVGFWLTVYPALRKALGYPTTDWILPEIQVPVTSVLKSGGDRRHYLRGRLVWQEGLYFEPFGLDNSGNFANLSGVTAFAILEQGLKTVAAGEIVPVVILPGAL